MSRKESDRLWQEICREIVFTKGYLQAKGRMDIWNTMAFYNEEIGHASGEETLHGLGPFGFPPLIKPGDEAMLKESDLKFLSELFTPFVADSECVARLVNRARNSHEKWSQGLTSQRLTTRLAEQLVHSRNLNYEDMFRLQALVFGVYEVARDFIEILPFEAECRESVKRLRQLIVERAEALASEKRNNIG